MKAVSSSIALVFALVCALFAHSVAATKGPVITHKVSHSLPVRFCRSFQRRASRGFDDTFRRGGFVEHLSERPTSVWSATASTTPWSYATMGDGDQLGGA